MPSRTFCFNGLFRKDLARFWPIWAAYTILWFLLLPLTIISTLHVPFYTPDRIQEIVHTMMEVPAVLMAFFFAVLVAMAVFSYLYQGRSTNFFHALPVRRERQFLAHCASGLFLMLSANVVIFLLSLVVEAAGGCVDIVSLLQWLAVVSMCCVSFFGFAAFCAMLTGHILALPCIYVILQLAFVVAEALVQYILRFFTFGMSALGVRLLFLSPCPMLFRRLRWHGFYDPDTGELISQTFQGWGVACIYCAVGVVFFALALLLYRRRRMEASSDVIAIRVLKPVFRWCLAVAGALCVAALLCMILFESAGQMSGSLPGVLGIVFLLIGGFIGWIVADILLKKSFRVFRDHWKGFGIFAVIVIVLSLLCQHGAFGYEKRVPVPDDVTAVYLSADGDYATGVKLTEPENIAAAVALHESILSNESIHEANRSGETRSLVITYLDEEDNPILSRIYPLSASADQCRDRSSDVRLTERLLNSREALRSRCDSTIEVTPDSILNATLYYTYRSESDEVIYYDGPFGEPFTSSTRPSDGSLTEQEAYELYTACIMPDMEDGNMGRAWLIQDADYARSTINMELDIELMADAEDASNEPYEFEYLHFQIPASATRTVRWLEDHGYAPETLWDASEGNMDMYPLY